MSSEAVFIDQVALAARWHKTTRTIARWREQGKLPRAELYLGRQPNWSMKTIYKLEDEMRRAALEAPPTFPCTAKAIARRAELRAKQAAKQARGKRAPATKAKPVKPTSKVVCKATHPARRGA